MSASEKFAQLRLKFTDPIQPQLEMFELDDDQWVKVYQSAYHIFYVGLRRGISQKWRPEGFSEPFGSCC